MEEERSETVISIPTSTTVDDRTEDISPEVRDEVGDDELRSFIKIVFVLHHDSDNQQKKIDVFYWKRICQMHVKKVFVYVVFGSYY